MAAKLSATEHQRIADELRAGKSVREVAELTGRGIASISRTASKLGLEREAERSQTKRATEANIAAARSMLAELAPKLAITARRFLDELWADWDKRIDPTDSATQRTAHAKPPITAHAKAQIMIATGIAVQRAREIVGPESDSVDLSELEAWLLSRRSRGVPPQQNPSE